MDYQNILMSKNGLAVKSIAKEFLICAVLAKTPTVTELSEKLQISRGTVQSAIRTLQDNEAIHITSRGYLGSFLTQKNDHILLEFAGIEMLVGAMPLPYSKKYEGLATGLISEMENKDEIPVSLSYMRGAKNRIAMVLENRYDFAVVSKYAAKKYIRQHADSIDIVCEFGIGTYCSSHVIIFHNPADSAIKDGMRIGIDADSIDQSDMTHNACRGKTVQYCPVEYNRLLSLVQSGDLDATVWNEDEIIEKMSDVHCVPVSYGKSEDTNAVIITKKDEPIIGLLLKRIIDRDEILRIQHSVETGQRIPSY